MTNIDNVWVYAGALLINSLDFNWSQKEDLLKDLKNERFEHPIKINYKEILNNADGKLLPSSEITKSIKNGESRKGQDSLIEYSNSTTEFQVFKPIRNGIESN